MGPGPGHPAGEDARGLPRVSPPVSAPVRLLANENPFGPSPRAMAAMVRCLCDAHRYPDAAYPALRAALARHHGVEPGMVVVANGARNALTAVTRALLDPGDEVVVPVPACAGYAEAAAPAGARVVEVPLRDFAVDLDAVAAALTPRTKLACVPNPHDPAGTIVRRRELERFLAHLPGGVTVILDEAFAEYVDDPEYPRGVDCVRRGSPVVVLRSFSAIFGLAGLRLGYAIAPAPLSALFSAARERFCVNRVAEAGALAALQDEDHVARCREANRRGRAWLIAGLAALGAKPVPSQANFVLADIGMDARAACAALEARGVLVCPGSDWGLYTMIRVTVGQPWENAAFLAALAAVLGRGLARRGPILRG
jgi:histidinol-phosphate aminotransferase